MKTMRIRAKALFEELSYLPIMSLNGRIAAIELIEKELIQVHANAQNNDVSGATLNDSSQSHSKVQIDDNEPTMETIGITEFLGETDVRY